MRAFLFAITLACFLLTTLSVAIAAPCTMTSTQATSTASMTDTTVPPCHQAKKVSTKQTPSYKHCKGNCLCLHASLPAATLAQATNSITPLLLSEAAIDFTHDELSSRNLMPPRRPPKPIA